MAAEHRRYGLLDWGSMNAEAADLLRRFAVEIDVRRPLMEFSTAIQQMVAIARAVSFKAQLVIMDEPTSSLDEREVVVLFDVMRRLRAEGVAVIFVGHRLEELYRVCDRVTGMRDGRTVMVARWPTMKRLAIKASSAEQADLRALRRQPAESAAGAMALHRSKTINPRRTDAGGRCRHGQAEISGADPESWPTQGIGNVLHDLLRAGGAARHQLAGCSLRATAHGRCDLRR